MSLELEIKFHVEESEVNEILEKLKRFPNSSYLGEIHKDDVYWAKQENDLPLFRTRYEKSVEGEKVLFTSKPSRTKNIGTEVNVENEFLAPSSQWENIHNFLKGLDLVICRRKFKDGYHFIINDKFHLHCELLNVKFLGWFLEIEITDQEIYTQEAENTILSVFDFVGLSRDRIETTGYNKMLTACGHEKGL